MNYRIRIAAMVTLSAMNAAGAIKNLLPLEKGYAIVTCSSGPARNAQGNIITPVGPNLDGFVVGIIDVRNKTAGTNPGLGKNWAPDMYHGENVLGGAWTAKRMGYVFGIATDRRGNIFVAATSSYGSANGQPYPDFYGPAGSGGIYKIDGFTGEVTDFIKTAGPTVTAWASSSPNLMPNSGTGTNNPGLGNLAYDYDHDQLVVTNFEDGKIYRVGSLAANAGTLSPPYDPFGSDGTGAPGFAALGERLWGIGYSRGRVYFARWSEDLGRPSATAANEIWSVAVNAGGALVGTSTLLLSPPATFTNYSNPIADIEFSSNGQMLLAERGMSSDTLPQAHQARVLKASDSSSTTAPLWAWDSAFNSQVQTGILGSKKNSAGGVDFAYVDENRAGDLVDCEKLFWATGDYLCSEGTTFCQGPGQDLIYGMQGTPLAKPLLANSYFVDFDGVLGTSDKNEQGDVDVWRGPCGEKGCIGFNDVQVECNEKSPGTYEVTVNYRYDNVDPDESPAENIIVVVDGVAKVITLNPKVMIGDMASFTFPMTGLPGQKKTVTVQLHGEDIPPPFEYAFCCKPQDVEIILPDCRCFEALLVRTPGGIRLQVRNTNLTQTATFLLLDLRAPANTTMSPTSINMTPTASGGTWLSPPLVFTPPLPVGATPTIFVTLHGKKLAHGVYEKCCSEEFSLRLPGTVVDPGTLTGWVFNDTNLNFEFDPREAGAPGITVVATERSGKLTRAVTNAAGEYTLAGIEPGQLVKLELASLPALPLGPASLVTRTVLPLEGARHTTSRERPITTLFGIRTTQNRVDPAVPVGGPGSTAIGPYIYPSRVVEFQVDGPGRAELTLLDRQGNVRETLARTEVTEGSYIANLDPFNLPAGEYTLHLQHKGTEVTERFVVDDGVKLAWQQRQALRAGSQKQ